MNGADFKRAQAIVEALQSEAAGQALGAQALARPDAPLHATVSGPEVPFIVFSGTASDLH